MIQHYKTAGLIIRHAETKKIDPKAIWTPNLQDAPTEAGIWRATIAPWSLWLVDFFDSILNTNT